MREANHKSITRRRKPTADARLIELCAQLTRVDLQYSVFVETTSRVHGVRLSIAAQEELDQFSCRVERLQQQIAAVPARTSVGVIAKAKVVRRAFTETTDGELLDDQSGLLASLTADLIGNGHLRKGGRI